MQPTIRRGKRNLTFLTPDASVKGGGGHEAFLMRLGGVAKLTTGFHTSLFLEANTKTCTMPDLVQRTT